MEEENDLKILNSQIELFLRILQTVLEKYKRFSKFITIEMLLQSSNDPKDVFHQDKIHQ